MNSLGLSNKDMKVKIDSMVHSVQIDIRFDQKDASFNQYYISAIRLIFLIL